MGDLLVQFKTLKKSCGSDMTKNIMLLREPEAIQARKKVYQLRKEILKCLYYSDWIVKRPVILKKANMGPRVFFFFRAHIIFTHSSDTVLLFGGLPLAFEVLLFPFSKSTQHNFYLHGCHRPVISVFFNLIFFWVFWAMCCLLSCYPPVLLLSLLPSHTCTASPSLTLPCSQCVPRPISSCSLVSPVLITLTCAPPSSLQLYLMPSLVKFLLQSGLKLSLCRVIYCVCALICSVSCACC